MEWDFSIINEYFSGNELWNLKNESQKKSLIAVAGKILENNYFLDNTNPIHVTAVAEQSLFILQAEGRLSKEKRDDIISPLVDAVLSDVSKQKSFVFI